jgi:hypothetical protein
MVMKEARRGAVSPGSGWSIPLFRAEFPRFGSKTVEHSRYLPPPLNVGKLGESSDKSDPMIGNQAESSDKGATIRSPSGLGLTTDGNL